MQPNDFVARGTLIFRKHHFSFLAKGAQLTINSSLNKLEWFDLAFAFFNRWISGISSDGRQEIHFYCDWLFEMDVHFAVAHLRYACRFDKGKAGSVFGFSFSGPEVDAFLLDHSAYEALSKGRDSMVLCKDYPFQWKGRSFNFSPLVSLLNTQGSIHYSSSLHMCGDEKITVSSFPEFFDRIALLFSFMFRKRNLALSSFLLGRSVNKNGFVSNPYIGEFYSFDRHSKDEEEPGRCLSRTAVAPCLSPILNDVFSGKITDCFFPANQDDFGYEDYVFAFAWMENLLKTYKNGSDDFHIEKKKGRVSYLCKGRNRFYEEEQARYVFDTYFSVVAPVAVRYGVISYDLEKERHSFLSRAPHRLRLIRDDIAHGHVAKTYRHVRNDIKFLFLCLYALALTSCGLSVENVRYGLAELFFGRGSTDFYDDCQKEDYSVVGLYREMLEKRGTP